MQHKLAFGVFYFGLVFEVAVCDEYFPSNSLQNLINSPYGSGETADSQRNFGYLNVGENCSRDVQEVVKGVLRRNEWAVKMFDSMEKFPSGFLLGRATAFGQVDECLSVVHPNFTGKHCVLEILAKSDNPNKTFRVAPFLPARVINRQFGLGLCVPSTCNSTDINNAIVGLGLNQVIKSQVYEEGCFSDVSVELRTKDYIVLVFFCFLIIISSASTAYDVFTRVPEKSDLGVRHDVLKSFSLRFNLRRLFDVEVNDQSQELNALHGIRFFSFTWIVLGHSLLYEFTLGNMVNVWKEVELLNDKSYLPATNAYFAVDSFFFMSGLLACFVFFKSVSTKGHYDAPVALINRYLRLTPLMAVGLIINYALTSVLPKVPYSKHFYAEMERNCVEDGWKYILYVMNLFEQNRLKCLSQAWYLSADMQMFLVSPLVLYVLHLRPKLAPAYLSALIVGTSFISFATSYTHDLPPNRLFDYVHVNEKVLFFNEYFLFHSRMSAWLVGVATAYFICLIKVKKINFSPNKVWIVVGWLTAGFLCLSSLYGMAAFMPCETTMVKHSAFERSTYRSFSRLGWSLGLSWIVIACTNNCGGMINAILSHGAFRPLSKLSYSGFIIHQTVHTIRFFNEYKVSGYCDTMKHVYPFLADLACSLFLAVPLTLLVEMPFANLQRILLRDLKILPYPKKESSACA